MTNKTEHESLMEIGKNAFSALKEMVDTFDKAFDERDYDAEEEAREAIFNDPLEIKVHQQVITLLTTGGPAVRIVSDVMDGELYNNRLQVQDWFTLWTDYPCDESVLDRYLETLGASLVLPENQ